MHIIVCYILIFLSNNRLFLQFHNITEQIHQNIVQCCISIHIFSLSHMKAKSLFMIIHDFYLFDNLLFIRKFLQGCVFFMKNTKSAIC